MAGTKGYIFLMSKFSLSDFNEKKKEYEISVAKSAI